MFGTGATSPYGYETDYMQYLQGYNPYNYEQTLQNMMPSAVNMNVLPDYQLSVQTTATPFEKTETADTFSEKTEEADARLRRMLNKIIDNVNQMNAYKESLYQPYNGYGNSISDYNLTSEMQGSDYSLKLPEFDNSRNYTTVSAFGYPNSTSYLQYRQMGNPYGIKTAVGYELGQKPDFSILSNTPLNMGLTAQPGQAHLKGLDTSLMQNREIINSPYSNDILENDCYQSERFEPFAKQVRWNEGENQGVIYATPQKHGTDQPTKYGISQGALDLYRNKFSNIADTYPKDVKYLTEDQAMNLLCQYYKGSRAEAINDPNLAFAHYDSFFNGDKSAVRSWQNTLNDLYNANVKVDGISGSELINNYNVTNLPDRRQFYNTYLKYRLPTVNDKNRKGISSRTESYR